MFSIGVVYANHGLLVMAGGLLVSIAFGLMMAAVLARLTR